MVCLSDATCFPCGPGRCRTFVYVSGPLCKKGLIRIPVKFQTPRLVGNGFQPVVCSWLVVNDRKFLVGIIFFFHLNQLTVLLYEPATKQTSQMYRLKLPAVPLQARLRISYSIISPLVFFKFLASLADRSLRAMRTRIYHHSLMESWADGYKHIFVRLFFWALPVLMGN